MAETNTETPAKPARFTAKLRFARITPRKLRYVVDLIRGKDYNAAEGILRVIPKRGAYFVRKLLKSAMDNATSIIREKDLDIDVNKLHIVEARVDEGPMFKRWRAAPMGRAVQIKKRMSHLSISLEEQELKESKKDRTRRQREERKQKRKEQQKQAEKKGEPLGSPPESAPQDQQKRPPEKVKKAKTGRIEKKPKEKREQK